MKAALHSALAGTVPEWGKLNTGKLPAQKDLLHNVHYAKMHIARVTTSASTITSEIQPPVSVKAILLCYMKEDAEREILNEDNRSHLIHWVERTDRKSTRAQQGGSSVVKEFLLQGTGGGGALALPPHSGAACCCWQHGVHWISCLFSLALMDKWNGKLNGHKLNSDWDRMQAACLKMRSENEVGKNRGKTGKEMFASDSGDHVCHPSFSQLQHYFHYKAIYCSFNSLSCAPKWQILHPDGAKAAGGLGKQQFSLLFGWRPWNEKWEGVLDYAMVLHKTEASPFSASCHTELVSLSFQICGLCKKMML